MVDVFISYSRANQEIVRCLAEAVKRLGYTVWWDDELPPHRSYSEVITEKIGQATAAIVVWSGGSIGSEWVRAEADLARNQKKLIQTSIDDCMPPMPFNQIQFASLAGWNGEDDHPGWNKVKGSLVALCGEGDDVRAAYALPESPPPAAPAAAQVTQTVPAPQAALPPRPAPRRSNLVVGGVIGGSLAVIAVVGVLALTRGGNAAEQPAVKPSTEAVGLGVPEAKPPVLPAAPRQTAAAPPPAAPHRAAQAPRPVVARQPQQVAARQMPPRQQQQAMPMRARRYCMNHMAQCMEMRRGRQGY